jgi:dTDP-4-amino-4,6-dideoxygalactose transaminase
MGPSLSAINSISDQIDGIVVTNVFGYQSKVLEYEKWCKMNGKLLLQDNAATPIGFVSDGRCIHDVGDGSFLSLHETKPLGRGEGFCRFAFDAIC